MLRGAKHSLIKKKNSLTGKNNGNEKKKNKENLKSTMSAIKRDMGQTVTFEEVHLIIKRCADEIRKRGLHEVDIFKPRRIGDSIDEVRNLITCLLKDSRTEYEDEVKTQNIHTVVAAMKWALRNCSSILVPYQYYEEFVRYEQEWDYDPSKGSFNKFLHYLPKQNKEILSELLELCAQVTAESHINKMSAERLVKTMALCIIGENDRRYENFDTAYVEWTKCSTACHHLFLAYLREKAISTELNPRLTVLLDNYVEHRMKSVTSTYFAELDGEPKRANRPRKRSIVTFAETTEITKTEIKTTDASLGSRPISILKVTRQIPTTKTETKRQTRTFTTLLPDMMDNMKRKTIIRPSTMMTVDEKRSAEEMWGEFQQNGITSMSDEFLKLFFSLEDRAAKPNSVTEKQWKQFSRKGFKSVCLEPLPNLEVVSNASEGGISETDTTSSIKEKSANKEIVLTRNDSGVSIRQTIAWDDFSEKGFRNSIDNVSDSLSLTSITTINKENEEKEKSGTEVISKKSRKNSRRKMVKFSSLKRPRKSKSFESTPRDEDWEDWDIIDLVDELPVTTHLAIETIDEIFPYVWMETTAAEEGEKWGEWVFIEPRKGLINECEWVMIEEKSQVFSEWETKTYTRRRKMSAFSTFSIPWVRGSAKSRPVSKVTSRMSKYSMASSVMPPLPAVWAMFDRSRPDDDVIVPKNYKFKNVPKNRKSIAQVRESIESIMFDDYDDGAGTMMQYQYESEEQYEYEDADYDYGDDPTGENGYYGYSSDPGYYGYNEYNEYQEEYGEEGYYYDEEYYNEGDYDYDQDQGGYGYSGYSGYEYTEEIEEVEEQIPVPSGGFVAQRQMMLQGELPAMPAMPANSFRGLSHESKYNNSKLFPMQSFERIKDVKDVKGKSINPKVTKVRA